MIQNGAFADLEKSLYKSLNQLRFALNFRRYELSSTKRRTMSILSVKRCAKAQY